MLRIALVIALVATACVPQQAAAPQAPVVQHVEPTTAPAPAAKQQTLIERFTALAPVLGKCEQWGADSMVCHPSSTLALWCSAPADGAKPKCEVALDWTPPAPSPAVLTPAAPPQSAVGRKAPSGAKQ
jgi:hypothetical protein